MPLGTLKISKPSGRLLEKLEETPKVFQYTSAINVGEIYYGANRSSRKKQILKAFEEMVFPNVNFLAVDDFSITRISQFI